MYLLMLMLMLYLLCKGYDDRNLLDLFCESKNMLKFLSPHLLLQCLVALHWLCFRSQHFCPVFSSYQGIPSLIILDAKTGNFITDNGRTQVMQTSSDESRKALVETWKSSEAVPIDQAVFSSGSNSWLSSLLMFVAKNPVYLFGLLYFVKQFFRYLESLGDDEEAKKEL